MSYKLQEGKYGSGWNTIDEFNDLTRAINEGRDRETSDKFHYRIIESSHDNVVWTKTIPYEGLAVNLAAEDYYWLQAIMSDYGISKDMLFKAILHWLSIHVTPNGI